MPSIELSFIYSISNSRVWAFYQSHVASLVKKGLVHCEAGASLVAEMVKNLPAMQETWFRSLGWEDPLKGMVTHFNILA